MTAIPESDPFSIEADSDEEANIQAGAASTSGDIPLRSYPPTASSSAERRAEQAAYENADLGGLDEEGHALLDDVDGGDAEREGRPGRGIRSEAASVLRARERRERTRRARGYFGPIGGGWNSKLAKVRRREISFNTLYQTFAWAGGSPGRSDAARERLL